VFAQSWCCRCQKMGSLQLDEDAIVMCFANSPATAPENVIHGNNSVCTNSLGLQVQSVVASIFSPQG